MINTDSVLHGFTDLKNLDSLGPIVLNQAKGISTNFVSAKKYPKKKNITMKANFNITKG